MPGDHLTEPTACMQVNMELDRHGVALKSYFRRHLVRGRPQRHLSMRQGHDYMQDASCPLPPPATLDGGISQTLAASHESAMAERLQLSDCNTGPVHQQGHALEELSVLWQPRLEAAPHMPDLQEATLLDSESGRREASCSMDVRDLVEEEELAAAAA